MIIGKHDFYTVHQVAKLLQVTPKTVWYRARHGHTPPLQGIGRRKGYPGWMLLEMIGGDDAKETSQTA